MTKILFLVFVLALALFAPAATNTLKKTKYIMFQESGSFDSPQRTVNDAVANFIDVNTNATVKFVTITNDEYNAKATANVFYEGQLKPGYSDPIIFNQAESITAGAAIFIAFVIFVSCF